MTNLRRNSPFLIAILTGLLFFLLPALNAVRFGHFGQMQFFESDTYYYLNVARFSQHLPFFSYDGIKPTNGFHPLWQWIEYLSAKVGFFPIADNWATLRHLFVLDLTLLSLAVVILAWFSTRYLRQNWLVFWIFCPGLLWFLLAHSWFFSIWCDLNGMETAVELFFFGLTLVSFHLCQKRGSMRSLAAANVLAGLMVLSRLDDVFFLLPLTLLSLSFQRVKMRDRVLASAPPYIMLAAYLTYNFLSLGILMPISGAHKAGLVLRDQVVSVIRYLLPIHSWSHHMSQGLNFEIFYHLLQMVVPAFLCVLFLCWKWRKQTFRHDLLMCVSAGVILKALYNFVFVENMLQGHWYYGPSIVFGNLLLVIGIDRLIGPERLKTLFPKTGGLYPAIGSALVSVFAFGMLMQYFTPEYAYPFYRVQESGPELRRMIDGFGDRRFVEFDDGEIAFASGIPSVSGFGLTGDPESVHALQDGSFLPLMEKRGITLMAAGGQYHLGTGDVHFADAPYGMWGGLRQDELKHYYWKYLANTPDVYFYRLTLE